LIDKKTKNHKKEGRKEQDDGHLKQYDMDE
jgi:hypothetical protein